MKTFWQIVRNFIAFPFVLPVLFLTLVIFTIEFAIGSWILHVRHWHPVVDRIDEYYLAPWTNWADYGVFKCS